MKRLKWVILASLIFGAGAWIANNQQVSASTFKTHQTVTVKSTKTKRYRYPASHYLGRVKSTKQIYYVGRVISYGPTQYVQLIKPANTVHNYLGNYVMPERIPAKKGYVKGSALKHTKVVLSDKKVKKQAYCVSSADDLFWNAPSDTKLSTETVAPGIEYLRQTVYVSRIMKTHDGQYCLAKTHSGKKIGWIYHSDLLDGHYRDPVSYLMQTVPVNATVWTNPIDHSRAVSVVANHQVKQVIVANDDETATVFNFENGWPKSYYTVYANQDKSDTAPYHNQLVNDDNNGFNFDYKTNVFSISLGIGQVIDGRTFCSVNVTKDGKFVNFGETGREIA